MLSSFLPKLAQYLTESSVAIVASEGHNDRVERQLAVFEAQLDRIEIEAAASARRAGRVEEAVRAIAVRLREAQALAYVAPEQTSLGSRPRAAAPPYVAPEQTSLSTRSRVTAPSYVAPEQASLGARPSAVASPSMERFFRTSVSAPVVPPAPTVPTGDLLGLGEVQDTIVVDVPQWGTRDEEDE